MAVRRVLCFLLLISAAGAAFAGDALWGIVREVKSAEVVVLDWGKGTYDVRLAGIAVPKDPAIAAAARELGAKLVLGRRAYMRLEGRDPKSGEMVSRLLQGEPPFLDVGLELVRAG